MTNVKDKLSASVKQARSQQQPLEAEATKADVTAETTPVEAQPLPAEKPKSVPKSTPKSTPKPAPKPVAINKPTEAAVPATSAVKKTSSNDVQPSGSTLFPSRVWPD